MDEALGQSAAVSPPCLIASIQEDKPGPSTAQEVEEGRDEEEQQERESREQRREEEKGESGSIPTATEGGHKISEGGR